MKEEKACAVNQYHMLNAHPIIVLSHSVRRKGGNIGIFLILRYTIIFLVITYEVIIYQK